MQSTGSSTAPNWVSPTNRTYNTFFSNTGNFNFIYNAGPPITGNYGIDELLSFTSKTITVTGNVKLIINASFDINSVFNVFNQETGGNLKLFVNGTASGKQINYASNNNAKTFSKTFVLSLTSGTYTIDFRFNSNNGSGWLEGDITGYIIEE